MIMNKKWFIALAASASVWAAQAQNILTNTNATSSASDPTSKAAYANDGKLDTAWNFGDYAPAWINIKVPANHPPIGLIRLIPAQSPSGETSHQISIQSKSGKWEQVANINQYTSDKQAIDIKFDAPLINIQNIRVTTSQSPSWIAWYEIQAFPAPKEVAESKEVSKVSQPSVSNTSINKNTTPDGSDVMLAIFPLNIIDDHWSDLNNGKWIANEVHFQMYKKYCVENKIYNKEFGVNISISEATKIIASQTKIKPSDWLNEDARKNSCAIAYMEEIVQKIDTMKAKIRSFNPYDKALNEKIAAFNLEMKNLKTEESRYPSSLLENNSKVRQVVRNELKELLKNTQSIQSALERDARHASSTTANSSNSNLSGRTWVIESTKELKANGWHAETYIRCTGSRNSGESYKILHLDSGRYKSVYGPTEPTIKTIADFHCN